MEPMKLWLNNLSEMELKITYVKLSDIKPYDRNATKHPKSQVEELAAMIREYGFTQPILLDKNNNIIAGHGRHEAAELIKMEAVPCVFAQHLSERQVMALRIADNKISKKSKLDFEVLADELSELAKLDYDLSLTGFDEQEIDALLKNDTSILPDMTGFDTKTVSFSAKKAKTEKPKVFSIIKVICPTEESEGKLNALLEKHGFQTA